MLAYWENELKIEAHESFDIYAGTSTGAIVAASLALGLSARKVLMLFQERSGAIFSREGQTFKEKALSFKGWATPAYSDEALRAALEDAWGEATMGDCPKPLSIAAVDVVTGSTKVFRSGHHVASGPDRKIKVVDAVMASTAAPTFFPSAQVAGSSFVDGALWANNPALMALLDARDLTAQSSFGHIRMLSLGCGMPFWGKTVGFGERRGLVGWGMPLMALMMAAQSEGVHNYMRRLLKASDYVRIDPKLPRNLSTLDNPENIPSLLVRAGEAARESLPQVTGMMVVEKTPEPAQSDS